MWELKRKKQYRLYGRLGINNISQFLIYQEVVDNVTCEEEAVDCTSIPVIDFVLLFDCMTHLLTIEGDFMVMWLIMMWVWLISSFLSYLYSLCQIFSINMKKLSWLMGNVDSLKSFQLFEADTDWFLSYP